MKISHASAALLFALTTGSAPAASWTGPEQIPPPPALAGPAAVPTFRCLGLSWSPKEGGASVPCQVRYRAAGSEDWKPAQALWFDPRNGEYRGSIVNLQPGTPYEISLSLAGSSLTKDLQATTWSEDFPIAKTVTLPAGEMTAPLVIVEGGTPKGYVLYTAAKGGTTIDGRGTAPCCVEIAAPYVILRGVTIRDAANNGIELRGAMHDVVIERCDISGWGRVAADGWGKNLDSAVRGEMPGVARLVVQRNLIHHPRSNANDWTQPRPETHESNPKHPNGPQGITLWNPAGNNVFRYNEIFSDESHRFNDGIGGGANFSFEGFPGPDSDIYGNIVRNVCDDGLEVEGGGKNIRVWDNYIDHAAVAVATAAVSIGPAYIFRNVFGISRWSTEHVTAPNSRGVFAKIGENRGFGGGRRYFFHNTILQPPFPNPAEGLGGAGLGIGKSAGPMRNTVGRNNILQVAHTAESPEDKSGRWSVSEGTRPAPPANDFDYDLCNGLIVLTPNQETHAQRGIATYAPENGPESFPDAGGRIQPTGRYALAPGSPGYDQGVVIANFNDGFLGQAPDIGAQESGAEPMQFGVNAHPAAASR